MLGIYCMKQYLILWFQLNNCTFVLQHATITQIFQFMCLHVESTTQICHFVIFDIHLKILDSNAENVVHTKNRKRRF